MSTFCSELGLSVTDKPLSNNDLEHLCIREMEKREQEDLAFATANNPHLSKQDKLNAYNEIIATNVNERGISPKMFEMIYCGVSSEQCIFQGCPIDLHIGPFAN